MSDCRFPRRQAGWPPPVGHSDVRAAIDGFLRGDETDARIDREKKVAGRVLLRGRGIDGKA